MGKEAFDDYTRYLRDREANSQRYLVLEPSSLSPYDNNDLESDPTSQIPPTRSVPSSKIRVGDMVLLEKNQRVPADIVLLRTSDLAQGTCFIRTDQLDGETDWKLKIAVGWTQKLSGDRALLGIGEAEIYGTIFDTCLIGSKIELTGIVADPPIKDINTFVGTFSINSPSPPSSLVHSPRLDPQQSTPVELEPVPKVEPLTVENVLWANTVLAAGTAVGFVIYTGEETRAVMNTSHPETKIGLLDLEINKLAKVRVTLCHCNVD